MTLREYHCIQSRRRARRSERLSGGTQETCETRSKRNGRNGEGDAASTSLMRLGRLKFDKSIPCVMCLATAVSGQYFIPRAAASMVAHPREDNPSSLLKVYIPSENAEGIKWEPESGRILVATSEPKDDTAEYATGWRNSMEADAIDAPAAEWLSALGEAAPGQGGGIGSGILTPAKGSVKENLRSQEASAVDDARAISTWGPEEGMEAKGKFTNQRPDNRDYLHMESEGKAQLDRMGATAPEKEHTNGGVSPREYGEGHVAPEIGAMSVEQGQGQGQKEGGERGEKPFENMEATNDRGSLQSASASPPASVGTALGADAAVDAVVERDSGEIDTMNAYELRSIKSPDGTSVAGGEERLFSRDSVGEAYKAETYKAGVNERRGKGGQSPQRPGVASVDGKELSRSAYDLGGEKSQRSRKQTDHVLSEGIAEETGDDSGGFPGRSGGVPGYTNPEEREWREGEGGGEDRSFPGGTGSDADKVAPEDPLGEHAANDTVALQEVQTGLKDIRTIEIEMERHVNELIEIFSSTQEGGDKEVSFEAAAVEVRHEVEDLRETLGKLRHTVNATTDGVKDVSNDLEKKLGELEHLRDMERAESAQGLLEGGQVKVDYTTGKIQWDVDVKKKKDTTKKVASAVGDAAQDVGEEITPAKPLPLKLEDAWKEDFEKRKEEWDPALLHLDVRLLGDFVILSMSAALGGVAAAGCGLPDTLGYLLGGMIVGPNGANILRMHTAVETFAQFGSIFLLFGHGLMYSNFFSAGGVHSVYAPQGRMGAFTVLFVVFSTLLVSASMLGVDDAVEGIFLSASATLSSTSMVTECVGHNRLGDTVFARMVIDLVAVQDLIMCPLLTVPMAIMYAAREAHGTGSMFPRITGGAILLVAFVVSSRRLLPTIMQLLVLKDKEKEQSSGLFTLGVVSYCLGVALLCEHLNLSHEAGALFAGLLMVGTPFAKKAHASMQPLRSLFGCIYLGSLGMIINPDFIFRNFGDILGCVLLVILIKFAIVAAVMKSFGFSWEASTLAGACMAQVSEISLFFLAKAQNLKLIPRQDYLMAVATTITLMVVSPVIIKGLQGFSMSDGAGGAAGFAGSDDNGLEAAASGAGHSPSYESATASLGSTVDAGFHGPGGGGHSMMGWLSPARLSAQAATKKREDEGGDLEESGRQGFGWEGFKDGHGRSAKPVTPRSASDGMATRRRVQLGANSAIVV